MKKKSLSYHNWKFMNSVTILGLILLLGMALRIYNLGAESYWIDEMSTVIEGQQSLQDLFKSGRLDQPPAYYIPFHFWIDLFGDSEVSTRSFSVLTGVGSMILVFIIGRMLFNDLVGLLSAFLMAISEFQIYYHQVARFYSFFEFMALLSFLFFIMVLQRKKIIDYSLYVLTSALMVYSHTYGIFILIAQNLYFLAQVIRNKNNLLPWLISQLLIGLALLPYLFPLLFGSRGIQGAIDFNIGGLLPPTMRDLLRSIYIFIMPSRRGRAWEILLAGYALGAVLISMSAWMYARKQGKDVLKLVVGELYVNVKEVPDSIGKVLMLVFWLLCPIILPFIASLLISPMYDDHYTISAAPAFYLLLALGLYSIRKPIPVIVSGAALLIMIVPGLVTYYQTDIHEQWRNAASYVTANSGPDDVILFAPDMGIGIQQKSFNWYYKGSLKSCGVSNELKSYVEMSSAVTKCISGYRRFWVIIPDYPNVTSDDRYSSFFLNAKSLDMNMINEQKFVGLYVYLFETNGMP